MVKIVIRKRPDMMKGQKQRCESEEKKKYRRKKEVKRFKGEKRVRSIIRKGRVGRREQGVGSIEGERRVKYWRREESMEY